MEKNPKITVLGACNIDLISYIDRMPEWGETLHGSKFHMGFGGKGANQAVMAAKLGADVTMISKIGKDIFGEGTIKNFQGFEIDTSFVCQTEEAMSGVAPINVDSSGRNSIIIVTGANDLITEQEIDAADKAIAGADILICQWEIPMEINLYAMKKAKQLGAKVIFNPAPARPGLPNELLPYCDIICPNEPEIGMLTNMSVNTIEEIKNAAHSLIDKGANSVLITLGARGSMWVTAIENFVVEGKKVQAKDTTGAGDCFIGSFSFFYAQGLPIMECMEKANQIAAISVQKNGTQTSFPDKEEIDITG